MFADGPELLESESKIHSVSSLLEDKEWECAKGLAENLKHTWYQGGSRQTSFTGCDYDDVEAYAVANCKLPALLNGRGDASELILLPPCSGGCSRVPCV